MGNTRNRPTKRISARNRPPGPKKCPYCFLGLVKGKNPYPPAGVCNKCAGTGVKYRSYSNPYKKS